MNARRRFPNLLLPLLLALAGVVGAADDASVAPTFTGSWHWKFAMPDGTEVNPTLKLTQQGATVTGTSRIRSGTETEITNGVVNGDSVSFEVVRELHGERLVTRYTGKRLGNIIRGNVESSWAGEARTYPWEAKRQAGIEGTWKWTTEFRGRKFESRVTLKYDAGKLTGSMPGIGRDARPTEIKNGTYDEGEVTFEVDRGRGEFKFHSKFQGKLEGDTVKGTIETTFGEAEPRDDDWNATRVE
ncbi:MAG TPA: hypothetical protein VNH84_06360 [Candidatus Saccharimonadales bacterium]|nr:hypothetical protein [Candidatus Saccharimonadales bacterium]